MQWEFVGKQELWESGTPGRGYAYQILLWRAPVPGGWLLMTINKKSNNPQPSTSFYPDPTHRWTGAPDPQADYLLRPARGGVIGEEQELLRADPGDEEMPRQIEP